MRLKGKPRLYHDAIYEHLWYWPHRSSLTIFLFEEHNQLFVLRIGFGYSQTKELVIFILMLDDEHVTKSNVISGGRQSTQRDTSNHLEFKASSSYLNNNFVQVIFAGQGFAEQKWQAGLSLQ